VAAAADVGPRGRSLTLFGASLALRRLMSSNFNSLKMVTGGTVPAAQWNRLLAMLQETQLGSVVNGQLKRSAAGTVLVIPPRSKAAPGDGSHPFKIIDAPGKNARITEETAGVIRWLISNGQMPQRVLVLAMAELERSGF
jgi:hypothetical protein